MRILAPNSTALARETQGAKRAGAGTFQLDSADTAKPQVPVPTCARSAASTRWSRCRGSTIRPSAGAGRSARARPPSTCSTRSSSACWPGRLDPSNLNRLRVAAEQLKDRSGEPGLDEVLAEIELRVEVELAKMSPREGHF